MKTVTITLHDTDNCGSSLQAYALQRFLLDHGVENEIIDYVPAYTQNNGHPLKTFIRKVIFFRDSVQRTKKFRRFMEKNLRVTRQRYTTLRQLRADPPQADCYITGSDQLWNSMYACGRDPAFYLDFIDGKKLAYAISLGREKIPENNLNNVREYAKGFSWVSVREFSSVEQIRPAVDCPVAHVCDPVLLNPAEMYDEILAPRQILEPYVLVYLAQGVDVQILEKCIQMARERFGSQIKIVSIGTYRKKCDCDYHMKDVSPGEFLSLIFHAEYIVSNSFHATVFSLIYQKQFATIVPGENGARIRDILVKLEIGEHAAAVPEKLPPVITKEKYEMIENKLDNFRKESEMELLDQLLR